MIVAGRSSTERPATFLVSSETRSAFDLPSGRTEQRTELDGPESQFDPMGFTTHKMCYVNYGSWRIVENQFGSPLISFPTKGL